MGIRSPSSDHYLVAGNKPWSRRVFDEVIAKYPGEWHFAATRAELTMKRVHQLTPRYIFFLHWSWRVPDELANSYECVAFHMTDVPYGRGGTPLQNLILRGHEQTKLTAFRMTGEFDAGPVYLKEDLSLNGSAEEVYLKASYLSAQMIGRIVDEGLTPAPQEGMVTVFRRRTPQGSEIPDLESLQKVYDFVRMLDAATYPRAFLRSKGFRYEFSRAVLYDGRIVADVTITLEEGKRLQ
jgi:methionyl-tRNA formyltransferase